MLENIDEFFDDGIQLDEDEFSIVWCVDGMQKRRKKRTLGIGGRVSRFVA